MLQSEDDFELLDALLSTKNNICSVNVCPMCYRPFENICSDCGTYYDAPTYEVYDLYNYNKKPQFTYKKLTHFKEVLSNFQGRECKPIPQHVLSIIKNEVNNDMKYLNKYVLKGILKKHKFTKYVENVNSILFILTGKQPPCIPRTIELKLIQYFKLIVNVFDMHKPSSRINFFNYYYVLYKLFELMNIDYLLIHVPRLKSKHRILEHDKIWRCVCESLNFEFIKTRAPSHQTGH
jgi:hypothetical protein